MSVCKHGKGWQVKIVRKGFPHQFKTFKTKTEAEIWEREILAEMDKGVFVSRTEAESTTLGELLQRFIDEYVPRLSSPDRQITRIRALMRRPIASRIVATIKNSDIAEFIRSREAEGVGGNTIRLDLAVFSRVFNIAKSNWGFESLRNPVANVVRPKIPAGRTRRINGPAEWRALLKAANPRFRLVLRFAVRTAMRREEIAGLTWDRVNLQRRIVYLPKTKNGEQRTIPLSRRVVAILRQAGPKLSGSVFGMSADAISAAMIDTRHRAGIEDLRFHDLRHEATSRLFEQTDLDVMEIKSITGHKTLQMLSRYSHLRTERLVARLDGARRGTPQAHGPNVVAFKESAR